MVILMRCMLVAALLLSSPFSAVKLKGVWDDDGNLLVQFEKYENTNSGGKGTIVVGQPRLRLKDPLPLECRQLYSQIDSLSASKEAYWNTHCWEEAPPSPEELSELAAIAFTVMPIEAGVMGVQPAADTVLINKETILYSQAQTQTMSAELMGTPVVLRAKPARYTWRFADGGVIETSDAGAPYPNQRVWHVYKRATPGGGTEHITLDISWAGAYSADGGGTWNFIPGRGLTTQTSHEFRVVEMRSRLIKP